MKYRFIFLLAVFVLVGKNYSSAQIPYYPFPTSNAQWSEMEGGDNMGDFYFEGKLYTLGNDTVIYGKTYTQVGYNETWYSNFPGTGTNLQYQLPGAIFGGIRMDSSKRVWARFWDSAFIANWDNYYFIGDSLPRDTDILLYAFNVKKGDTIKWVQVQGPCASVVTSVDSVLLSNGEWRNEISIQPDSGHYGLGDQYIDGIGSLFGLLGPLKGGAPEGGGYNLACFTSDTTFCNFHAGFYLLNDVNCTWIENNIDKINTPAISIFPNPASTELTTTNEQLTGNDEQLEIINVLGERVLLQSPQHNNISTTINISALPPGIYFIRLNASDGSMQSAKFVKE